MIYSKTEKIKSSYLSIIPVITLLFFVGVYLFARTFMGIYILAFRIGELAILFSLLCLIFSIIFFKKNNFTSLLINTKIRTILLLILLSFILNVILSNTSLTDTYTFKSSSYIWSIGFFFLGFFFPTILK